jgi:hypothetical protein
VCVCVQRWDVCALEWVGLCCMIFCCGVCFLVFCVQGGVFQHTRLPCVQGSQPLVPETVGTDVLKLLNTGFGTCRSLGCTNACGLITAVGWRCCEGVLAGLTLPGCLRLSCGTNR